MAAAIGLAITNVVVGLGNIGAGIGFTVAEQNKMDEVNTKGEKLTKTVQAAQWQSLRSHLLSSRRNSRTCEERPRQTAERPAG